eukprot:TRINITY_DN481_c0_g1_i4.p1 TRINITY_DN481_c0_g1~~TRINITY_DN481_c0_g1_i4.p1  ORF type:complete len:107 (+),score=7.53 TRINITY_DN481_c0_g1_i4:1377-1697(+)
MSSTQNQLAPNYNQRLCYCPEQTTVLIFGGTNANALHHAFGDMKIGTNICRIQFIYLLIIISAFFFGNELCLLCFQLSHNKSDVGGRATTVTLFKIRPKAIFCTLF